MLSDSIHTTKIVVSAISTEFLEVKVNCYLPSTKFVLHASQRLEFFFRTPVNTAFIINFHVPRK